MTSDGEPDMQFGQRKDERRRTWDVVYIGKSISRWRRQGLTLENCMMHERSESWGRNSTRLRSVALRVPLFGVLPTAYLDIEKITLQSTSSEIWKLADNSLLFRRHRTVD